MSGVEAGAAARQAESADPIATASARCGRLFVTRTVYLTVWKKGRVRCWRARHVMRRHAWKHKSVRGWSCPDKVTAYYCYKRGGGGKAFAIFDNLGE